MSVSFETQVRISSSDTLFGCSDVDVWPPWDPASEWCASPSSDAQQEPRDAQKAAGQERCAHTVGGIGILKCLSSADVQNGHVENGTCSVL